MDEHAEVISLGLFVWRDYVYLHDFEEEGLPVEARQGDRAEGRRGGRWCFLSPFLFWLPKQARMVACPCPICTL